MSDGLISAGRSLESENTSVVVVSENITDKLSLLNYELDFCRRVRCKPFQRYYFAFPSSNPSDQFYHFVSLISWLLELCGLHVSFPERYDDPNPACSNMLNALKDAGFSQPTFPTTKLRHAFGIEVCGLIDSVLNMTLEKKDKHALSIPIHESEHFVDEEDVDPFSSEAINVLSLESLVDNGAREENVSEDGFVSSKSIEIDEHEKLKNEILLKVDRHGWRKECERIFPQLNVNYPSENKDWRSHMEDSTSFYERLKKYIPDIEMLVGRLESRIGNSLDKVKTRERFLNNQYQMLSSAYRECRELLSDMQFRFRKSSESISGLTNELQAVSEELDTVKANMDEKSNQMTETSPVIQLKKSMNFLKSELREMEVRIGVAEHTLLNISMKERGIIRGDPEHNTIKGFSKLDDNEASVR